MASGDLLEQYRASVNLTVTSLAGLASSSTFVSGWSSGTIDNTVNLDLDHQISAKFTVESAGLAAGQIRMYAYSMLDDTNWPDLFSSGTEGSEGAVTLHDTEYLAALTFLFAIDTDTTASRVYPMLKTSLRWAMRCMPPKYALYVTQSTGTTLETSGQQVTYVGEYNRITP